jgi:hypothetical protein
MFALRGDVSTISSVKEFQLSHSGHLPIQRKDSYPQLEQMYFIFVFRHIIYSELPTIFSTFAKCSNNLI